jgi:parallel beta-helix repeat protein
MKLIVAILLVAATSAYGSTRVVNNNPANTSSPCHTALYSTISSAIAAANPGDTIEVCPSTYPEAVYINKANLKLTGINIDGSSLIELDPSAGYQIEDANPSASDPTVSGVLVVDSVSGVAIKNISVNGYAATTTGSSGCSIDNVGIYFRNASGSIVNSAVSYIGLNPDGSITGCQEGLGVFIESYGGTASVTMTGNSIHDFDKNGITADGSAATLVATNNAVTGAGPTPLIAQNGIQVSDGAKGTVNSNVVSSVDYTPSSTAATGILFYLAADDGQVNNNVVSDSNNGVYFQGSNHNQADGNNISKTFNYDAVVVFQSDFDVIENNIISRAGLEVPNQEGIYVCGSNNKIENNTINEAPIGIQIDETGADGCSGASGNYTHGNVYYSVGVNLQTLAPPGPLDGADTKVRTLARLRQPGQPKVSPSK